MVERHGGPAGTDDLERALVDLGRALVTEPPPEDLVEQTLLRLGAEQGARQTAERTRVRRRLAGATAALAVLVVAAVPPVRAAVLDLLRIGAVVVRQEPAPATPTSGTAPASSARPTGGTPVGAVTARTLAGARAAVGFPFAVPSALGPPTEIAVTHEGRVVELTWSASPGSASVTHLDVLGGSLDWGYLKQVWTDLTSTEVDGHPALWIGAPHRLQWVDRSGTSQPAPARTAGPTLVWVVPTAAGEVTYRLEGPATLARATEIASSAR